MEETDINESSAVATEPVPQPETEPESEGEARLRAELPRMSISALTQWLGNFGYEVAPETPKAELIEAVMKLNRQQLDEAEKITAEAVTTVAADDDPMVTMVFENLECPGAPIEFTYQKGGFKVGPNGKVKPAPRWKFFPGRSYKVPLSVVNHLNALRVPADRRVSEDGDGMIRSVYSGAKQNRFACRVEFTDDQVRALMKGK